MKTLQQQMEEIFADCKTQEEIEERIMSLGTVEVEIYLQYLEQEGVIEKAPR